MLKWGGVFVWDIQLPVWPDAEIWSNPIFPKVAQNFANAVFAWNVMFQNSPKVTNRLGYFCNIIFHPDLLKKSLYLVTLLLLTLMNWQETMAMLTASLSAPKNHQLGYRQITSGWYCLFCTIHSWILLLGTMFFAKFSWIVLFVFHQYVAEYYCLVVSTVFLSNVAG